MHTQTPQNTSNKTQLTIFNQKSGYSIKYLGNLVKISFELYFKIQYCFKQPINFIVVYNTKNMSYFVSNKDSFPNLFRSNFVYQLICLGSNSKRIGKTDRCLSTQLTEHGKPDTNINNNNNSSSILQHLLQFGHAKYIINMYNLHCNLHDNFQKPHIPSSYTITNLIFNCTKILHSR